MLGGEMGVHLQCVPAKVIFARNAVENLLKYFLIQSRNNISYCTHLYRMLQYQMKINNKALEVTYEKETHSNLVDCNHDNKVSTKIAVSEYLI